MARCLGILGMTVCVVCAVLPMSARAADLLYDCPVNGGGGGGDFIDRGFYVENFGGLTLGVVSLTYATSLTGSYTVSLTAHQGTYDGPVLGSAEVTFDETGGMQSFDLHDVPINSTMTIAFVQSLTSSPPGALVYYDTGPCGIGDEDCTSCPEIYETEDTTAPLSTFRRRSVGLMITGRADSPAEQETWGRMKARFRD